MATQAVSGYKLLEVLGEGPRATVYKARDPNSRTLVAVKVFHNLETSPAVELRRLQHPNVAAVLDVGRSDSQGFAVSEYLPGGTLKEHLRSMRSVGDVFPPDQILAYAEQIASALMYAHTQGIAHGSVKPENVMFSEDGTLKLTDFSGGDNPSSDIEAFGKLLYELTTGQLPFPGAASPAGAVFRKDLPQAFCQFVMRLLDRERSDHYIDLRSALADLKSLSSAQSITPLPSTMVGGS